MRIQGIYAIRNTDSGRVYVGSSQCIKSRWKTHRSALNKGKHHASLLQRSWTKHGPAAFSFEVLEVVQNAADLMSREQHWIDTLSAFDWSLGFNGRPSADSPRGHKVSQEIRAAMSASRRGRKKTPEHAAKLAPARNEGRKRWIAKIRSDPLAALAHSEKLRKSHEGAAPKSKEVRARIGLSHRGKIVSPETRAKQSVAQKKRFARDMANGLPHIKWRTKTRDHVV